MTYLGRGIHWTACFMCGMAVADEVWQSAAAFFVISILATYIGAQRAP